MNNPGLAGVRLPRCGWRKLSAEREARCGQEQHPGQEKTDQSTHRTFPPTSSISAPEHAHANRSSCTHPYRRHHRSSGEESSQTRPTGAGMPYRQHVTFGTWAHEDRRRLRDSPRGQGRPVQRLDGYPSASALPTFLIFWRSVGDRAASSRGRSMIGRCLEASGRIGGARRAPAARRRSRRSAFGAWHGHGRPQARQVRPPRRRPRRGGPRLTEQTPGFQSRSDTRQAAAAEPRQRR